MKKIFLLLLLTSNLYAAELHDLLILAMDDDLTYLGNFENEFHPYSIFNELGEYGSKFSPTSIFNEYGKYGGENSLYSPFNIYAPSPPGLWDREGNFYGVLSLNRFDPDVTEKTFNLAKDLKRKYDLLNGIK